MTSRTTNQLPSHMNGSDSEFDKKETSSATTTTTIRMLFVVRKYNEKLYRYTTISKNQKIEQFHLCANDENDLVCKHNSTFTAIFHSVDDCIYNAIKRSKIEIKFELKIKTRIKSIDQETSGKGNSCFVWKSSDNPERKEQEQKKTVKSKKRKEFSSIYMFYFS